MSNIEEIMQDFEIVEALILCLRDGKDPDIALLPYDLTEDETNMCFKIAEMTIALYDGKFPVDHLAVGDICIDAFGCSPCIITNINERTIHVLYFNGKAHKFRKNQEGQFKKLGPNMKEQLALFIDDCQLFAKSSMEIKSPSKVLSEKIKKGPGYDFPIAASEEDVE